MAIEGGFVTWGFVEEILDLYQLWFKTEAKEVCGLGSFHTSRKNQRPSTSTLPSRSREIFLKISKHVGWNGIAGMPDMSMG